MDPLSASANPQALLEHAAWVRRLARGLVADVDGAAELEQQTWLAALTHAPRIEAETGAARGWLARVAANLVHRSRRTRARIAEREELAARSEAQPSAAELVERADLARALLAHLVALEEPYRSTLLLRYCEELSPTEIARRERIPVRTVNTRLARGRAQLRERLDRSHDRGAWLSALVAFAVPPNAAHPIVPTLILMKTSTKLLCGVVLLLLIGAGAWFALRGQQPDDARVAEPLAQLDVPATATPAPAALAPSPERTAAPAPDAPPAPAPERTSLRGRVVDPAGRPIPEAHVELSTVSGAVFDWSGGSVPESFARTTSAPDGTFSIELAPLRVGELTAAAPGFGTAHAGRRRAGDFVELVLERAGVIEGRVTREPTDAPVAGVKIVARGTDNAVYNPVLAEAVTDASGAYRIGDLGARDYWVSLAPGRGVISRMETVSVSSGATVVRDFRIGAVRDLVVRGRVVDAASSAPLVDAVVRMDGESSRTDTSGAFELHALVAEKATTIALLASARGFVEQRIEVASAQAASVEIGLIGGRRVTGKVVDADGAPIERAQIALFDDAKGPSARGGIRARSQSDGSFEIDGLQRAARCGIFIVAEGHATATFALAPLDAEHTGLGAIELAPAAALVARIVDEAGQPWTDCDVWLRGGGVRRGGSAEAEADAFAARFGLRMNKARADGRAVFGELPAGEYTLQTRVAGRSAWVEVALALEEGEVRDPYEVVIPRGLSLQGRAVDPEGRPVAGVFVLVQRPGREGVAGSANTGSDGAFAIAGLEPGEHVVRTTIGGVATREARERFASGKWTASAGDAPLELVMPLVASIRGRVVGADGAPVAGATVSAWDQGAGMPDATSRSDENGEFRLSVRAGTTLELRANAKIGAAIQRASIAQVAAGAEGIELRLSAP